MEGNRLGHVLVEVKLTNPLTNDNVTISDAVVDTGGTFSAGAINLATENSKIPFHYGVY